MDAVAIESVSIKCEIVEQGQSSDTETSECSEANNGQLLPITEIFTEVKQELSTEDVDIKLEPVEVYIKNEVIDTDLYLFQSTSGNANFNHLTTTLVAYSTYSEESVFKCRECQFKTTKKAKLQLHISIHTGQKPFKCPQCEYRSSRKDVLQRHIRIHTGEKPFACKICKYKFRQKAHLEMHMKTHTGEKPLKCTNCEFATLRRADLMRHMKTHAVEKCHECKICGHKFAVDS